MNHCVSTPASVKAAIIAFTVPAVKTVSPFMANWGQNISCAAKDEARSLSPNLTAGLKGFSVQTAPRLLTCPTPGNLLKLLPAHSFEGLSQSISLNLDECCILLLFFTCL